MNSEIEKSPQSNSGKEDGLRLKPPDRIVLRMTQIMLLFISMLAFSAQAYDFEGMVEEVSEPNGLTVNVTEPGKLIPEAKVEVLLENPLPYLSYFKGKKLQFDILGHDILGRPICDAYLDGTNIRDAYYCRLNPVQCSYYRHYLNDEPASRYPYSPCYGQCGSFYPAF